MEPAAARRSAAPAWRLPRVQPAWASQRAVVCPAPPYHVPSAPAKLDSRVSVDAVDEAIRANLRRQLAQRERAFGSDLPFSWPRLVVGAASLALVFSDIPRSGLGVRDLGELYHTLEPDCAAFYDPWSYAVARLARDEADALSMHNQSARAWSYASDSTSVAWRAMATHLGLAGDAFPSCLVSPEPCAAATLRGPVVFAMLDALAGAVADADGQAVQLRSVSAYVDRVHDFVPPASAFALRHWRTSQALHYSSAELARVGARICHVGGRRKRPNVCQERWANYRYACAPDNARCRGVGRVLDHTLARVGAVRRRFPGAAVDLTLIESQEDAARVAGGISTVGVRRSDLSTVIRARRCAATPASNASSSSATPSCETVYVEDYRYQAGLGESDAPQWYSLIAALRVVGQTYFIVRVAGLMLSCYYAHVAPELESGATLLGRLRLAWRVFSKVPTQCVVFGSPLPVLCYALAHAIDAPLTYVVLEKRFTSQNGVLHLGLRAFVSVAVVQMRNVWIFTVLLHAVVALATSRRWTGWCHWTGGVLGVPEFLLSGFSSATIAAQFRSTAFRSTRVLAVFPVSPTARHDLPTVKYQQLGAHRGAGTVMLGGLVIDLKCLVLLAVAASVALAVSGQLVRSGRALRHYRSRRRPSVVVDQRGGAARESNSSSSSSNSSSCQWLLLGKTPVPYSAGTLWPTVAMCVHWTSDFFCIRPAHGPSAADTAPALAPVLVNLRPAQGDAGEGSERRDSAGVARVASAIATTFSVSVRMNYRTFSAIQLQMERVHDRRAVVEANVAFMNLVIMSDPLVYARRFLSPRGRGTMLGYYRSLANPQANVLLLLPRAAVDPDNEHMQQLELLRAVPIAALSWSELVQCG